ncbi:hypothetical protein [Flavimaricola marinus]|uniref:Uncharacterized protein n=1 Tax=Flavimaricola marinus TaxID=1819565 RepID=A0A238LH60_9RHOB|nr:hypothetical protein [Flavimaricola marinus]SMY08296.1 hypothetical protein LOM8899_02447 [Flavimaricola marinus]
MPRGTPVRFTDFMLAQWGKGGKFLAVVQRFYGELRWSYTVANGKCDIKVHGVQHRSGRVSMIGLRFGASIGVGVGPLGFSFGRSDTVEVHSGWTTEVDPEELFVKCAQGTGCQKVVKVDIFRNYAFTQSDDLTLGILGFGQSITRRITNKLGTVYLKTPCDGACCPPEGVQFVQPGQIANALPKKPRERLPKDTPPPWEVTGPHVDPERVRFKTD